MYYQSKVIIFLMIYRIYDKRYNFSLLQVKYTYIDAFITIYPPLELSENYM